MYVSKIYIENFKIFKGSFELELNEKLNIIVGDNEAGKSTILEAIHLALSGLFNDKYLKNELSQYLFNSTVINEYLANLCKLPRILIEIFFSNDCNDANFKGDFNHKKKDAYGIRLEIAFNEDYQSEYDQLIRTIKGIKTLPIEYYDIHWDTFARKQITTRSILLKSTLIDSSSTRYQNGGDLYISRIIKNSLESEEIIEVTQAYRNLRDKFSDEECLKSINSKIQNNDKLTDKNINIDLDFTTKNLWESHLMTFLDNVPFHYIGKGEQCKIKTKLALSSKKAIASDIILLEEPENHLSSTNLNHLIDYIDKNTNDKQIIISTHSSFVANKLGLNKLIMLSNKNSVKITDLSDDTQKYFQKLPGYDTLRLILCKKAILVEGPSDELIIQKAFMSQNEGKLPIACNIELISVGTAFLRFLEIANQLKKSVSIITDNDANIDEVNQKYKAYENHANIKLFYCKDESLNTLEPTIIAANQANLQELINIINNKCTNKSELLKYMINNKTESALKIFISESSIKFPDYILEAIKQE